MVDKRVITELGIWSGMKLWAWLFLYMSWSRDLKFALSMYLYLPIISFDDIIQFCKLQNGWLFDCVYQAPMLRIIFHRILYGGCFYQFYCCSFPLLPCRHFSYLRTLFYSPIPMPVLFIIDNWTLQVKVLDIFLNKTLQQGCKRAQLVVPLITNL